MDKFKQKIRDIEVRVDEMDSALKVLQGMPTSPISNQTHYQNMSGEQGEVVLDEFDTYRFLRVGKKEAVHIVHYSEYGTNGTMGTKEKNMYILQNVPRDILEYVKALQNKVFYPADSLTLHPACHCLAFHLNEEDPDISKTEMYVLQFGTHPSETYTNSKTFRPSALYFPMSKEIKDILDEKIWEFSDFRTDTTTHVPIFMGEFSQEITVDFKNNYKILPHVSFYLTPVRGSKITASIKSLTKKRVVFEMKYGLDEDSIPTSGCLHWKVDGVVVHDDISLLD